MGVRRLPCSLPCSLSCSISGLPSLLLWLVPALSLTSGVAAQERYELSSTSPRGAELRLALRRVQSGDLEVELRMRPPGERPEVRLTGPVHLRSRTRVEARLAPPGGRGVTGVLAGDESGPAAPSELLLELHPPDGACRLRLVSPSGRVLLARGARVVEAPRPRPTGLRGRLLALGRKGLDEVLGGNLELAGDVPVRDFLHLGVSTRLTLLHRDQLEPEQETALGSAPGATWIETEVEGGVRLPFQLPIPVGPGTLTVGIEPGTALRYRVRELHPLAPGEDPEARRGALSALARRAIDLPLTAEEALSMGLGAERAMEGEVSLALKGQLGLGLTTACLGDVVEVGGQARVGGVWRVTAPFRLSVLRQEGERVRLRWTRARRRELSGEARLFLGVAGVDREALGRAAPPLEYFQPAGLAAGEAASLAGGLLRFQLRARSGRLEEDELDLIYGFDLSEPAARAAYDRAVRGDLTAADELAARPGAPVWQELRVVEHEQRSWCDGEVGISELLRNKTSRALSVKDLELTDGAGSARLDVIRAERKTGHDFLFGVFPGAKREASLELVRGAPPEGGPPTRSLRWKLVLRDPRTSAEEIDRLRRLAARWGLPLADEDAVPTPEKRLLRSRFGRTRTLLQVDVSPAGLEALLAAAPADLRQAWARAEALVRGREPTREAARGAQAIAFARHVGALAGDRLALAEGVSELARLAGSDPTVAAAILEVVPPDTVRLRAEVDGKRVDYDGERRGERFAPARPLYGH